MSARARQGVRTGLSSADSSHCRSSATEPSHSHELALVRWPCSIGASSSYRNAAQLRTQANAAPHTETRHLMCPPMLHIESADSRMGCSEGASAGSILTLSAPKAVVRSCFRESAQSLPSTSSSARAAAACSDRPSTPCPAVPDGPRVKKIPHVMDTRCVLQGGGLVV